jgi:hypothetical protein
MKPTVGRQVHYYSNRTFWHQTQPKEVDFEGPFAATIVAVHDGGSANLLICYPSPCYGSSEKTELVEGVREAAGPTLGRWCWPPRVP